MDILWFLQRRLRFISDLYDTAIAPFQETMRKIEAGEEPFIDGRDPEYASEPAFLNEYLEAHDSVEVLGQWCLCMVHASLKAFLEEYVAEMARDYRSSLHDLSTRLGAKKGKSGFERYRLLFLEDLYIDWAKGPVKLAELEQINLTRDDLIHNVDVTTNAVYKNDKHAERHPEGLFTDEMWANMGMP